MERIYRAFWVAFLTGAIGVLIYVLTPGKWSIGFLYVILGLIATAIYPLIRDVQLTKKEDREKQLSKSLVLTPHTYAIGLSGMTGYPNKPENAAWLLLEVFVNAIDKPIDTLDLIIDGKTIPANHWPGKNVTAFNVYFNVTEWQWKGKNQVELIAHIGDKMQRSGRITIDFNVEVFGTHLI